MKTRSCAVNRRCDPLTNFIRTNHPGLVATYGQQKSWILTLIDCPPINLVRYRVNGIWPERLVCHLHQTPGIVTAKVDTTRLGVDGIGVRELNVEPDLVSFPWNNHARTICGVNRRFVSGIWKVSNFRGNDVDNTPDKVFQLFFRRRNLGD
jgi:hypothetical protein